MTPVRRKSTGQPLRAYKTHSRLRMTWLRHNGARPLTNRPVAALAKMHLIIKILLLKIPKTVWNEKAA